MCMDFHLPVQKLTNWEMGTVIFFEVSLDHIARLSQTNKMKGREKKLQNKK